MIPKSFSQHLIIVLLICIICVSQLPAVRLHADEPKKNQQKLSPEHLKFFENKIRPVLVKQCVECHGEKKQKGGLRLDSKAGMLRGGESGPAIAPGKIDESMLIEAIKYESYEMPPSGKLADQTIRDFEAWVRMGAPDPRDEEVAVETHEIDWDQAREYWAFQPLQDPEVPQIASDEAGINDIDRFIIHKLHTAGLTPAPQADRRTLIRRLYFDLTGLPPSPKAVDEFVNSQDPQAYEKIVDHLLESPHYGEHWGRYWLDLVRYGESDGYRADGYRPHAWRYRDYVVKSFNNDKPYDQFVREQLAGDELAPHDPDALVATGFLRHGLYEFNQRNARMHWQLIMEEKTDVVGEVFLGMSIGCARCHDHKFDPVLRKDYYRLQAFFTPILWRDDVPLATPEQKAAYQKQLAEWEAKTEAIRAQIDEIEKPYLKRSEAGVVKMFPEDIQEIYWKPKDQRNSYEEQMAYLVYRQVLDKRSSATKSIKGDKKKKLDELKKQLAEYKQLKPKPLPSLMTVSDAKQPIAPTVIPGDKKRNNIPAGFLTVLDNSTADITPVETAPESTGRRAALAKWLTKPDNPLATRVIVNRIWQYHFGRGLVSTPSEFGNLGQPPTHPELLDYLTQRFLDGDWKFKNMHRLMLNSATYKQSAFHPQAAQAVAIDPENKLRWRTDIRRLRAEQIRDAMLSVTGELKQRLGGSSVPYAQPRRSLYLKVIRNTPDAMLASFDMADGFRSTSLRDVTTTPGQTLLMINGEYVLARAKAAAKQILKTISSDAPSDAPSDATKLVKQTYRLVLSREPSQTELAKVTSLFEPRLTGISKTANPKEKQKKQLSVVTDLCHVLFNSNEFLYLD